MILSLSKGSGLEPESIVDGIHEVHLLSRPGIRLSLRLARL